MKRKMKGIVSLALAGLLAIGTGVTFSALAETGSETAGAVSPADLWQKTSGVTVEANVEAPDTMKYGAVVNNGSSTKLWVDENSEEDYLEDWETNGVKITSTVPNKKIYFNNILNVDTLTTEDYMFVFSPLASIQGTSDFTFMELLLEDADDPDNYLKIEIEQSRFGAQYTFLRASTAEISPRGYKWGNPNSDVSTTYGSECCYISFNGTTREDTVSQDFPVTNYRHRAFKLSYNAEKSMLSLTTQQGKVYTIACMTDGHLVGYGKEWEGFKANRVRLSMKLGSFQGLSASVMVFNVFGQGMNGTTVKDTTAPVLKFEDVANEVPKAEVGKKYSVFDYTCDDVVAGTNMCEVSVKDPDGNTVAVTDSFTPTKTGYYTLTYQGQDDAGNVVKKEFSILAQNGLEPISVQIKKPTSSFVVGEEIALPSATLSGGAGALSYSVSVTRAGGNETIDVNNDAFTPLLAGEYLATYTAVDYVGNETMQTIAYTVTGRDKPMLLPVQKLVKLFDGVAVDVPMITAYDLTSVAGNKLDAVVEITAKNAGGTYSEKIENGVFVPDKEKFGDSVTFNYKVACNGNVGGLEEFEYTVAIQDVPKAAEDYFSFDENIFSVQYNEGGKSSFINFTSNNSATGDIGLTFANPVGAEGFELAFAIPAQTKNFETLTLKLRDSMNAAIGFDMEIRSMTSGADKDSKLFVRSGGVDYAMSGSFNTMSGSEEVASKTPLRLQYLNGVIKDYTNEVVFSPAVNFDGGVFEGFPSRKVYLEIEFGNVSGMVGITITKIANQTLGKAYNLIEEGNETYYEPADFQDTIRPQIRLDQDIPDEFVLNQQVEIPYARAFDVLSPHVDVYVTLRSPQGKYIYQDEISKEGMVFTLDSYGSYSLRFVAEDAAGRKQTVSYTISVKDLVEPTIVLQGSEKMELKVGETVTITDLKKNAIVQDNRDTMPQLYVMVIAPNQEIVPLRERLDEDDKLAIESYTFTSAGTYYLRYYVIDASYNTTWKDIVVVVK